MGGYGQFCPVAQAAEVLAERWTPLVLRELLDGATRFNDVHRGVPQMSTTLLSKRLRALEQAGIVERTRPPGAGRGGEYVLTPAGRELEPVIAQMGIWSERWLRRPVDPEDTDIRYLMWLIRGLVATDELPPGRTVFHYRFPRAPDKLRYWWLIARDDDVDLCFTDPGFDVDVTVSGDPTALASVIVGDMTAAAARRERRIEVTGSSELVRSFSRWFGVSRMAEIKPARPRRRWAQPAAAAR